MAKNTKIRSSAYDKIETTNVKG